MPSSVRTGASIPGLGKPDVRGSTVCLISVSLTVFRCSCRERLPYTNRRAAKEGFFAEAAASRDVPVCQPAYRARSPFISTSASAQLISSEDSLS